MYWSLAAGGFVDSLLGGWIFGSSRWGKVEKGLVGPYNTEDVDSGRSTKQRAGSTVWLSHCIRTDNVCHYNTYAFRGASHVSVFCGTPPFRRAFVIGGMFAFVDAALDSAVAHR